MSGCDEPGWLRSELERVSVPSRDFVLYNHLPYLATIQHDSAALLVHDIISGELEGISPGLVAEMCRTINQAVAVQAFSLFSKPYPFNSAHLTRRFMMHDSIPYIEEVRDSGVPVSPFMYTAGIVEVGFHLCSGLTRDHSNSVHRKRHDETTYLYGCSSTPEHLYKQLTDTSIHTQASANRDRSLLEFSLRNPHHTERTRRHVISFLSCEVLAECFEDRVIDRYDVGCWIDTHSQSGVGLQIGAALNLECSDRGSAKLQRAIILRIDDISTCTRDLDLGRRRQLAGAIWPDAEPEELETLALLMASTRYDTARLYRIVEKLEADSKRRRGRINATDA